MTTFTGLRTVNIRARDGVYMARSDNDAGHVWHREGEVEGVEYADWVREEVTENALNNVDSKWVSSGGWLARRDDVRQSVRVFRLVEEIEMDDD